MARVAVQDDRVRLLTALRDACKLQLLEYPKKTKMGFRRRLYSIARNVIIGHDTRADRYFWPHSLLTLALETVAKKHDDRESFECLLVYYEKWIREGLPLNCLDNAMHGYTLTYLFEETGDPIYGDSIDRLAQFLIDHPRDKYGSLPYRPRNGSGAILVDSLGMISPFLSRYGRVRGNKVAIELAVTQIENFLKYGVDRRTLLPYHGYQADYEYKLGIVGWGRGVGWLMMSITDSLQYSDRRDRDFGTAGRYYRSLAERVIQYQREDGSFSWQLEAIEGPTDTSATAMIAYSMKKAINIGLIDASFSYNVDLALSLLLSLTENGIVGSCSAECEGLGMYPQRYGSYPWAQGPTTALLAISL